MRLGWKWPNRLRLSGEGGIQKDLHGILEMLWTSGPDQDLDLIGTLFP